MFNLSVKDFLFNLTGKVMLSASCDAKHISKIRYVLKTYRIPYKEIKEVENSFFYISHNKKEYALNLIKMY